MGLLLKSRESIESMRTSILIGALGLAQGLIDLDHDEKEWFIDELEPELEYLDYDYSDLMLEADLLDFPGVSLKSADSGRAQGGIRVRNMGRIMKMAMFIQKKAAKGFIREFKRYGCHCWPRGRTFLGGHGKPQDEVDRTCKKLFNCHRCLVINTDGQCSPDKFQYKVRGKDINGTRLVHCDGNEEGTCQRSLCECDLAFAKELNEARQHYSNEFSKWKGFDQANECQKIVGLEGRNGRIPFQTEYEVPDEIPTHNGWACCGDNFHNSTPYKPSKGQRCCANNNIFSVFALDKQQTCCSDGTIGQVGECPS